ncbi:MAG: hypothetical protein ACRD5Z_19305, partial [Bryobacteraceae bacterium]
GGQNKGIERLLEALDRGLFVRRADGPINRILSLCGQWLANEIQRVFKTAHLLCQRLQPNRWRLRQQTQAEQ